jgi:hypothetical protein
MIKIFLSIAIGLVLSGWTATAQIPVQLQIAATNGIATVFSPTNSAGYFIAQLESTTNLSPPIVWTEDPNNRMLNLPYISNSYPVLDSQRFFRLLQFYPVFQFAIFYNLNMEIDPGSPMTISARYFATRTFGPVRQL